MKQQLSLPTPPIDLIEHSQKLIATIQQKIQQQGAIPFQDYMQQVLYTPGLGYYAAGMQKFGDKGDFITAPETSPLFAQSLAKQCQQVFSDINNPCILEFGAGSGIMAADLLLTLEQLHQLPQTYYILEVSAELKQRQQQTLASKCPHLLSKIIWLDNFPQNFSGVILANEVLDAMPVCKFQYTDPQFKEYYVNWKNDKFTWELKSCHHPQLETLRDFMPDSGTYDSEINLTLPAWIQSVSDCLVQGLVLLIDYGFPRHEFYHPDRSMGTIMCHYQHRSHPDPFVYPGLQDITAHVDFTAVAEAADHAGLTIDGFTTQAGFLLSCGILENNVTNNLDQAQQIKLLTLPSEMGELFKVIALSRNIDLDLLGFNLQDRLTSL